VRLDRGKEKQSVRGTFSGQNLGSSWKEVLGMLLRVVAKCGPHGGGSQRTYPAEGKKLEDADLIKGTTAPDDTLASNYRIADS